jgi:hypothetical protein
MRKTLLILAFLPLVAFVTADWIAVKLDDRVSVNFPSVPQQNEKSGNTIWMADGNDASRCMAMVMDFSQYGLDSAGLASEMGKPESFEQFRDGVVGQIEGSSVISEKNTFINGRKVFEFLIDMGKADSSAFNKMYNRNYFIGTKMYSLSFFEKNDKPQPELRNKFFNSFKAK